VTAPSGDLSTILFRRGRLSVTLDPRNLLLAGLGLDPGAVVVHVAVFGLRWQWRMPEPPAPLKTTPEDFGRPSGWMPGDWGGPA
jgi:hypothetical protein